MSILPAVSVVMSVFNGATKLPRSIESVLDQKGVELEFVIVNDGSTDNSGEIIQRFAKQDSRIHIENQPNKGLTRALIKGCLAAQNGFVARQDVGDYYLPDKLFKQAQILNENPTASMVTCGTRFVGPEGEYLFDVTQQTEVVSAGLKTLNFEELTGPSSHPSVMFRRSAYQKAGGYRPQFMVAQDMDLWLRLIELGDVISIPEVLLEAEFAPNSISGASMDLQIKLGKILIECAIRRRYGGDETELLKKAANIVTSDSRTSRTKVSDSNYFIARSLQKNNDKRCIRYFNESLRLNPFSWKTILASIQARLSSSFHD